MKSPVQRVRVTLKTAREIAWESFEAPSESTVMAIFHRLCVEADLSPFDMPRQEPAAVH